MLHTRPMLATEPVRRQPPAPFDVFVLSPDLAEAAAAAATLAHWKALIPGAEWRPIANLDGLEPRSDAATVAVGPTAARMLSESLLTMSGMRALVVIGGRITVNEPVDSLDGVRMLLLAGSADPLFQAAELRAAHALLTRAGATAELQILPAVGAGVSVHAARQVARFLSRSLAERHRRARLH